MLKSTVWQRTGLTRWNINPTRLLEELIREIVQYNFSELVDIHIREGASDNDEISALRQSAMDDFTHWTLQSIQALLEDTKDVYTALGRTIDTKLRIPKLIDFATEARSIFFNGKPATEKATFPTQVSLIARALQETTLNAPLRLYNGKENVTKRAEIAFHQILLRMEYIRGRYGLNEIPNISQTTNLLFRRIALADEYVWLSLKPLITAPLSEAEMSMNARNDNRPTELAYQIVKGDGVILVTGYRGVGKSTFINATLLNISEAEAHQVDELPWKIIPIQMNVAKASNAGGILRLSIRATYRTFRKLEDQGHNYLTPEERKHLWFANLRASYKVNVNQAEALSKSRSLSSAFGFKPMEFLTAPLKLYMGGLLPELQYKTTKDWNEKMDRTISLLDYDEDRAEEDVIQFIAMLSTPRTLDGTTSRIKLVFIYDEMDKMEVEQGQSALIGQLKNLLLTRHAVFILVTSKEFYYMLLDARKKEDSILGSVFSSMITVPMFDSANTNDLLMKFITDSSKLTERESILIGNVARYLTYRARGLPREIIRELRSMQQWVEGTLQAYITDRLLPGNAILIYAKIQDVIENLNNASQSDPSAKDSLIVQERIWHNEGRREQIRRGLYILVEDILNKGVITFDAGSEHYKTNFGTITSSDFLDIVDQLARNLEGLRLPEYPEAPLFHRRVLPENNGTAIVVEPIFYNLTGRQVMQAEQASEETPSDIQPEEVLAQVNELIQQDSLLAVGRALNLLTKNPGVPVPTNIQDRLYQIFLRPGNLSYRIEAGKRISPDSFYKNLESDHPKAFLETETNEQLLNTFLKLVSDGARNKVHRKLGANTLGILINRIGSDKSLTNNNVLLTALISSAVAIGKDKVEAADLLARILKAPGAFRKIPDGNLESLQALAIAAGTTLPSELLNMGYYSSFPISQLIPMLATTSLESVVDLWNKALKQKSRYPYTKDILTASLVRLTSELPETTPVLEAWLGSTTWNNDDKALLVTAHKIEPRLYFNLERAFGDKTGNSAAHNRITDAIGPVVQTEMPTSTGKLPPAASTEPVRFWNPWWLNLLIGGGIFAAYLLVPIQVPTGANLYTLILGHLLNLIAILTGLLSLTAALFSIVSLADLRSNSSSIITKILFVVVTIILSAVTIGIYWWLLSKGYPITVGGQLLLTVILASIYLVPITIQGVLRLVLPKPKQTK